MNGHTAVIAGLLDAEVAEIDVDVKNANGLTALMLACQHGNADAVTELLKYGADIEMKDKNGLYNSIRTSCI